MEQLKLKSVKIPENIHMELKIQATRNKRRIREELIIILKKELNLAEE